MISDWKKDLNQERSLWQVYQASKRLPKSPFNKFVYAVGGMVIVGVVVIWLAERRVLDSASSVILASEIAFDFAVQILGFLIGGFAIFVTVTDDRLMVRLAQTPMSGDLSVFKHIFFNFLAVFYIFLTLLSWSILIRVASEVEVVKVERILLWTEGKLIVTAVNALAFAILASLILYAVVRLKSFIWNIYQGFLTFLGVSDILRQSENQPADKA